MSSPGDALSSAERDRLEALRSARSLGDLVPMTDAEVVEIGRLFLRYVAPTFGFTGVFHAYKGGFRGAGRTLTAAIVSIAMLGVIRVPFAWVAARPLGYEGIWLAFAVSNVAGAAIGYLWYARGRWRDADVTGGPGPATPGIAGEAAPDPEGDPSVDD
ncbi:hypothetical protein BRC63_03410 [Halobacteriales archaeon QH_10_70_21]|nr:MAG: hypothetical protein BRC63_03410 [Halobacteriales archaeon QH_10_70_21]